MTNTIESVLDKFTGKKILIVGDLILDKYIYGEITRISPEAPVPIVQIDEEYSELGGAGNVAANVAALGGEVFFFGFIGKDREGETLKDLFAKKKIAMFLEENQSTITKTRILGKQQYILRIDKEEIKEKIFSKKMKDEMLSKAEECDIIIISDYAKGTITKDLMDLLKRFNKKIIVDPKPKNKELFHDVLAIKPNEKETFEMSPADNIEESVRTLKNQLNTDIISTLGERGMLIYSDKIEMIPTFAREVFDLSGAGDTVIAALAMSLASGATLEEAAIISNHAAGISVEKRGTYAVTLNELRKRILNEEKKIVTLNELIAINEDLKRKKLKIATTNGSFDILHLGHIDFLKKARSKADILIVLLNSDSSIKALKGKNRPILNEKQRSEMLAALEFVDYVCIFNEDNPLEILKELKPNFHIKGGSFDEERISEEKRLVESWGGSHITLPLLEGYSTTNLINKILDTYKNE